MINENHKLLSSVFKAFMANNCNLFNATRLAPTEKEHVEKYYKFMCPPKNSLIVDLGCGSGEYGHLFQMIDSSLRIINVVNDNALINLMQSLGRVCVNASFEKTGLESETADIVMFNESIGHGDIDALLKEAYRLLKPNGILTIKDFSIITPKSKSIYLDSWGYAIHQPPLYLAAAYHNGFSVEKLEHPPLYTKHWFDIIEKSKEAKKSALLHDPKNLPLCTVLYKFKKGNLNGESVD
jgi:ubiquinone/menaquinone biosynthesis C-methylase UbiE